MLIGATVISAQDNFSGYSDVSFGELGVKDVADFSIDIGQFKDISYYSYSGGINTTNFSTQLSGNAKTVYNSIKVMDSDTKSIQIVLNTPVSFTTKTAAPTSEEMEPVYKEIKIFTQMAIDAYSRDYPENFWLDIANSYYNFNYRGNSVNGKFQWTISMLTYEPAINADYAGFISGHDYKFNKAVENFTVTGKTRYEKLKSIYTQLCKNTEYKNLKYCRDAYGPLVAKYGVCSGYAKAFKLICDREQIPCMLVTGTSIDNDGKRASHMWNLVQMEDYKWYCVDVTWGDTNGVNYDYFLTGTDVKISNISNKTFGATHLPSGDFSDTGYFNFKYPEMSKTAYDPDWTPPTANPSPVPVKNPELGDSNRSGIINADDALVVLKVAAKLLDNSDGYYNYGDMSNDGQLLADDALLILKLSAKIS